MLVARIFAVVLLLLLLCSDCLLSLSLLAMSPDSTSDANQGSDLFENRIRPVLVARCIKCHGPSKSESGLRLDRLQSILTGGDSGPALIPGDAEGSLLASVLDHQHDVKMPPDKQLNEFEIQAFKQWIAGGAYWPNHAKLGSGPELRSGPPTEAELDFWAFQPLKNIQPPTSENSSHISNDIDRFVQAKLAEQSLSSNPPAEKQIVIRRVTFDLTGLPPTPEAIEQFVNDNSPEALEKLVDRLLGSQAYGERWGRHWLDVVRYSDTAGETADYPVPDAWRYRNYVIDAFNRDKPYDQFLREQIAGDVLAYQDVRSQHGSLQEIDLENFAEQITATGFIAIARRFGFDSENYHHLTIQDTIDTVGQATLGLSFGCARCHDHKFDPLSMDDYYALYGIFESTLYPLAGSEQKQKVRSLVPLQPDNSRPDIASKLTQSIALKQEVLQRLGRSVPSVVLRSLTELDGDFELQSPASGGSRGVLVGHWLYDGPISVTNAAQSPFVETFPKGKVGVAFPGGEAMSGIWQALNHRSLNPFYQPLAIACDFRVGPASTMSEAQTNRATDQAADLATIAETIAATNHHGLRVDLCGHNTQASIGLLVNESVVGIQVGDQFIELAKVETNKWYNIDLSISPQLRVVSGRITEHGSSSTNFGYQLASLPNELLTRLCVQTSRLPDQYLPSFELDNLSIIPDKVHNGSVDSLKQLAILGDAPADAIEKQLLEPPTGMSYSVTEGTPHDVQLHLRGEPSQPGKLVARRMPELFRPTKSSVDDSGRELIGSGRLDLANWITGEAKPLAARVMVNRIWQQHFGRGLVRTENDFGARGELPTHPELLDWLAGQFIKSGWSIKQLHRLIIGSASYQQSSQPNQFYTDRDPENRWLWRFSPRRLSAEEIRDAMLLVSGKLDTSVGKEHPFPPPHTWAFSQHSPFYAVYETDRRSVYLMQQRIKRHPFLALFDGADPNVSTARRETTIVPTQALYLMNNPFVHEVADRLADTCTSCHDSDEAIQSLYVRCLGRQANVSEIQRATQFMERYLGTQSQIEPANDQHRRSAWAALARTMVTRNEFLFVE